MLMPLFRSTWPASPNIVQAFPEIASMAISLASRVPRKIRYLHAVPARTPVSSHAETPRETNDSEYRVFRSIFGSYAHFCWPVAGSNAITRLNGVLTYNVPLKRMGVASNLLFRMPAVPSETSPVRNVHATCSFEMFSLLIWFAVE